MMKTSFPFLSRWNLFYKLGSFSVFLAAVIWLAPTARAINISAVYSSACQRDIGVIINVDDADVQLLTLSGEIKTITRFNIIYIAYYPVGKIPIQRVLNPGQVKLVDIKTIYNDKVAELVEGWMIDHSEKQISFLTLDGTETVIDTEDIWDIEMVSIDREIDFPSVARTNYRFVHPYPFMYCNNQTKDKSVNLIYPQHLLEDPILIKRELDRLKEGYDTLKGFDNDKAFYAVPQVFSNDAILGVWATFGSRYGGSKHRKDSFIPEIISESSSGPFGFQYRIATGNSPIPSSVHEEPQMQVYYKLKADYVHFSIMVDINRYVTGETLYEWHKDDLQKNDNRENDTLNVAGGFDYGPFSIDLSIWNRIQYGVRHEDFFQEGDIRMNKGAVSFQNRHLKAELFYGFGNDAKPEPIPLPDDASSPQQAYIDAYNKSLAEKPDYYLDFSLVRLNLDLFSFDRVRPSYSLIVKSVDFKRENNANGEGQFQYAAVSLTNALYIRYRYDDEIRFGGYLSLELLENKFGIESKDGSDSNTFIKGGVNIALVF